MAPLLVSRTQGSVDTQCMAELLTDSTTATVLVVEDTPEFRIMVEGVLESAGYEVSSVEDGRDALAEVHQNEPDVIVLDIGLPGLDGVEVCREIRTFSDAYIVMLTGRTDDVDCLVGLAVGADDYITKPFSPRELVARIQVLLRRPRVGSAGAAAPAAISIGDLRLDLSAREVRVAGDAISLTKIEFDLLALLASRPSMVFERQLLMESVWGCDWARDDHVVDVHIANLRSKLDRNGVKHLRTVRGVGYQLISA